jgi:hypothetical protein
MNLKELYLFLGVKTKRSLTRYQRVALHTPGFREAFFDHFRSLGFTNAEKMNLSWLSKERLPFYTIEQAEMLLQIKRLCKGRRGSPYLLSLKESELIALVDKKRYL